MNKTGKDIAIVAVLLGVALGAQAQPSKKALEDQERLLAGPADIHDRALGIHDRSNIGHAFENRGKLYPRRSYFDQGIVSGEFPIGSGNEYIYRMNPMVGIPGNVVQARWTENSEWEAAAGYHNRDSARVAQSDRPSTWPAAGWPVRDALGNPRIVSDQDTYCVYNDSTNAMSVLLIQVNQTGYAFSGDQFKNMVFFTYQIVNNSSHAYDSLYFGLYMDIDVGSKPGSGGFEYSDDKVDFERTRQLVYFYDDGYTADWPGNQTGYFGVAVIATPPVSGPELGITDLHYNLYDDDLDSDTVQYGIMSSARSLYESTMGPTYFHPGANAPDLHFDDAGTIPESGLDIVATLASGPHTSVPGDTLTFVTALVAGRSHDEIMQSAQSAHDLATGGFVTGVAHAEPGVPRSIVLFQNYPNPFNSSTTIRYGLPERSHVTLTVFNPLGQNVAELVNGEVEAGDHAVRFDASGLASGVYMYRLQAGAFVHTRKVVLLR